MAFLPVSSLDLNPIALVFAGLKADMRGTKARTPEAVITAIGAGLDQLTPSQLQAYYRHCGYGMPVPGKLYEPGSGTRLRHGLKMSGA